MTKQQIQPGLSAMDQLARFVAETPVQSNPAAIAAVRYAVLDTWTVALAGRRESAVKRVRNSVGAWGTGPCLTVDGDQSLPPPWAALLNGTAAHALDFDDNFDPAKAHASAVLIPALWALAEIHNKSEAQLADAYGVGLQILAALGAGMNPAHRDAGWHATSTLGTLGAAAACARLLGLEQAQAAHALSLATSLAGGFMSQFGSDAKPLHAGLAAQHGVMAASLAVQGITASPNTIDGTYSLINLMRPTVDRPLPTIPDPAHLPTALLEPGLKVKRWANCASAHRSLDSLETILGRRDLPPDAIRAIHVVLPASHARNLMHPWPQSPSEARFSLPFALAYRLCEGPFDLAATRIRWQDRPDITCLMHKVTLHPLEKPETEQPTCLSVTLDDGEKLEETVHMPKGSSIYPLSLEERLAKARACLHFTRIDTAEPLLNHLICFGGDRPCRSLAQIKGADND